ncbi:hypothetical protein [Niabella hirudinis]|uniref:hypothetical protein n=1 Tax=Niabella hirudinis TaxID=1285929 RepID=UPI003EBC6FD3
MKTITIYTVLVTLLALAACSKKTTADTGAKFPDDIAGTWARSATGSASDTVTDQGTGQKWVKDIVILSSSEAAKLQRMIAAVPKQKRDDFAETFRNFNDKAWSAEFVIKSDLSIQKTQEYKDFYNFCVNNRNEILPLAFGYLFNDVSIIIREGGVSAVEIGTVVGYENLKKEVVAEIEAHPYTEDGKYRIDYNSGSSRERRLAKKIISQWP